MRNSCGRCRDLVGVKLTRDSAFRIMDAVLGLKQGVQVIEVCLGKRLLGKQTRDGITLPSR